MKWNVSAAERPSGKRTNQDRHLVLRLACGATCVAVLDGHGHDNDAVDHVFRRLPELIGSVVTGAEATSHLRSVFATLAEETSGYQSGTTCSVALLYPNGLVTSAVLGDSPIIARCNAKKLFFGEEHNIRSNTRERRAAEKRGGICGGGYLYTPTSRHGLQVARAFGNKDLSQVLSREPSIESFDVAPGYYLLLCSDGFISLSDRAYSIRMLECFERIERWATAEELIAWSAETKRTKHSDDSTIVLCRSS